MKFYRPLVNAVVETLPKIFEQGVYADVAVAQILQQNPKWGARDRRFIAENIYEIVRWWRMLSEIVSEMEESNTHFYYKLFAVSHLLNGEELPEWEEFKALDKTMILEKYDILKSTRKYRESIPDWLDTIGIEELGEDIWEKEIHELNKEASVVLRVNTLKTNTDKLYKQLKEQEVELHKLTESASIYKEAESEILVLQKRKNLESLPSYKEGLFEIQDASSQLVAHHLQVKQGMVVIDACAGAGGKTLQIAALMKNQGKIIAMDVEGKKLNQLKMRAKRAGASIIQTKVIDDKTIEEFKNKADRLLLDVPCSGLGVLKRTPDAKWKLSLAFIEQIKQTQQAIISRYSTMLKPGGIMVYATCSILPSENERQVNTFLEKHPSEFELIDSLSVLPSQGFDGFYMASIRKK